MSILVRLARGVENSQLSVFYEIVEFIHDFLLLILILNLDGDKSMGGFVCED